MDIDNALRLRVLRRQVQRTVALACCAALAFVSVLQGSAAAAPARMWIVGATVISPERQDSGQILHVMIEGDRIAAVTATLPADAGHEATIVHAEGRYLIPGLIDSHVHMASIPALSFTMQARHQDLVDAYRKQVPRSYLRYGYTTLVDLIITDPKPIQAMRAAPAHPDIYDCGGALSVPNGYPSSFAPAEDRFALFPNTLYDPIHPEAFPAQQDPKAHSPQAAVERIRNGAGICVKTFYERGYGRDRNLPVPSAEIMRDVVAEARSAHLPVLLHANSFEAQTFGVDTGVSILAHGMWDWGTYNSADTLPPQIKALLDRIVERSIGYQPTLQVIGGLQLLYDSAYLDRPAVKHVIPPALLSWHRSEEAQWYKRDLAQGAPDAAMRERLGRTLRRGSQVVQYLAQHHARFLFGTDTPSGPTIGNLPGLNGYLEMQRLVSAGMSLRQLFEAATLSNAKAFALDGQVGTLQPGKRANLVLLGRSPLESVEAYDEVRAVWLGGAFLDPANLEATQP
jgi:imidazolonepropionase-like amidohydrolase